MIIGTAGHIDHGKTSLVKALTGTDADRLLEEKQRGITIDLGFAYWPQDDGTSIGFVDVPGHEGYIHNMLAGISSVDAMMLVIAVNDGIKPQTVEHAQIADLLGIKHGVVALTKCDLADETTIQERIQEIRAFLSQSRLKHCAIIPLSTKTGLGLEQLKNELRTISDGFSKTVTVASLTTLSVDRSFSLEGVGTVVTGGVRGGNIRLDDKLLLSPSGREIRVRGIHAQNKKAISVKAGERAAINLASINRNDVKRGDRLVSAHLHFPTSRFDCSISLLKGDRKTLPVWTPVHFHCGTGHWPARLVPLQHDKLILGQSQLVQIVLDAPIAVQAGDHFVLRDASASRTMGGGIILDRRAPNRNRRKPERLKTLAALATGGPRALPVLLALPPYAVDITNFCADHGIGVMALDDLVNKESLIILKSDGGHFVFAPAIALLLSRQINETLRQHHERNPDQAGMTADRLRLALPHRLGPAEFSALIHHLERRNDVAATGAWLRLPDHVPRLSKEHEMLWEKIRARFSEENRFKPPKVGELAAEFNLRPETIRGLMKRLARRGDVQEIVDDHYLQTATIAELSALATSTETASAEGWFDAATYRDKIGIGRKMAILILEFFDLKGFTIRKGDLRKIDPRKRTLFQTKH